MGAEVPLDCDANGGLANMQGLLPGFNVNLHASRDTIQSSVAEYPWSFRKPNDAAAQRMTGCVVAPFAFHLLGTNCRE
jgi:hypothetical protein